MKKIILIIMAVVTMLGISACGDKQSKIKTLQLYICPITTIMSLRVLYADFWGL